MGFDVPEIGTQSLRLTFSVELTASIQKYEMMWETVFLNLKILPVHAAIAQSGHLTRLQFSNGGNCPLRGH